jgi:hypothetical protein
MINEPTVSIACDSGCGDSTTVPYGTTEQINKNLTVVRWLVVKDKHFCSDTCFEIYKQIQAVQHHKNKR